MPVHYAHEDLTTALTASTLPLTPTTTPEQARAAIRDELTGYGVAHARETVGWRYGDAPEITLDRRRCAADLVDRYGDVLQPAPLYALTVHQPYAAAITHLDKRVENRTWAPPQNWRGWLLLHAGRIRDQDVPFRPDIPVVHSAVTAVVRLTDVHRAARDGTCCPWGEAACWHWQFDTVHALPRPVGCQGRQRLWTPAPHIVRAVRAQLPAGVEL